MANAATFRKLALALDATEERSHMNHPDFRVRGKIFATLTADESLGMVKLTPDQQEVFLSDHPKAFKPVNGAWGRQGCTHVVLSAVKKDVLETALLTAWQNLTKRS